MTEQHPSEPSVETFESAGQQFRQARETRGLTVEDAAARLNIAAKYITAIEASDMDALPGPAFVKGYVRAYARYLELPADALVADFGRQFAGAEERKVASINKVGSQVRLSDPLIRISVYVFFLAVLGISIWWWQTQSGNSLSDFLPSATGSSESSAAETSSEPQSSAEEAGENDPMDIQARLANARQESDRRAAVAEQQSGVEPENAEPVPTDQEPQYLSEEDIRRIRAELRQSGQVGEEGTVTAPASEPAAQVEAVSETQASSPAVPVIAEVPVDDRSPQAIAADPVETAAVSPDKVQPAAAVENIADQAKPAGKLMMTFVSDCWISIRDASGKLLVASTQRGGETLELDLEVPASLLVGRVSAVTTATFNGQNLDLASLARKDVARLKLNL